MVILSLEKTSFDDLFVAFNEAFGNYDIQINKSELEVMLSRRGFVPELSFGAFNDSRLVSFTLNGIGEFGGLKTAYDTGTGTIEEYRGQGIASRVFNYSIPYLESAGVSRYLLEVLQHNSSAVSVYTKIGFSISREFNYYMQPVTDIKLNDKTLPHGFQIKTISLEDKDLLMRYWDFTPSWQNSFESIERNAGDFTMLGVHLNGQLVGYCIFEPGSGDVTQLAVNKEYRRRGVGTALLAEALKINRHDSVKVVNTEVSCQAMTPFLESYNIPHKGKQYEMIYNMGE